MKDVQTFIEKVKMDIRDGKSDEEIFQSLLFVFGKDRQTDEKLAELLGTVPHERVAGLLQRVLEITDEKKVRKIIKRSLYRLKSRGIAVQEVSLEKGGSILRPLQSEPQRGFGSGIDSIGQRLLLLVIPHAGRMWTVMQGIVSDTQGLIDFSGEEMTRKGFRAFLEDIQEKAQFPLVEMEPAYVGFLFASACRMNDEKSGTPPKDYLRLKSEVEGIKKEYDKPLIYSCLRGEEISGEDWTLRKAGDLLKNDLFSGWRIEENEIRPYADAVWEADESKIVLNQAQKEARFQEIYLKALSELFPEEKRLLYKKRLEEMAYVLFKLGREDEARISLAAAIDLEKPVNPIQPNPFLFQLVIQSIFTLLSEAYEKKTEEPSLILKP